MFILKGSVTKPVIYCKSVKSVFLNYNLIFLLQKPDVCTACLSLSLYANTEANLLDKSWRQGSLHSTK